MAPWPQWGHAHVQIWSTAKSKIIQKGCTDFIFKLKLPLLNSEQLWSLEVLP